jgi:hypothetical protein
MVSSVGELMNKKMQKKSNKKNVRLKQTIALKIRHINLILIIYP